MRGPHHYPHLADEAPELLGGSLAKVTQHVCATLVGLLGWSQCMVATALRHFCPSGWPRGAVPLDPASLGAELPAAGVSGFFWGAAQLLSPRNTRPRRACCPSADSSSLKPDGSQTIFGKEGLLAVWRADLPAFAQG